jgi:HK97 gp10 family phage protein
MSAKVIVLSNRFAAVKKSLTQDGLKKAALAGGMVIQGYAKINANQVFSDKATNALANSIQTQVTAASNERVTVAIGPTVVYGAIQEFGGIIRPVLKKFLRFVIDGQEIFSKMVQLPARPYLRPAVDEHEAEIVQAIEHQLEKAISEAL